MARAGRFGQNALQSLGAEIQVEIQGRKLEFIPGHAGLDADGKMISDGMIGFWTNGRLGKNRFNVVTFFESKAGSASARGLRRSWTGIVRAERPGLLKEAQEVGIEAFRDVDQDAAEALSESVAGVRKANRATRGLTNDEILRQFPEDVQKAWSKLPQSEAGQIRKTTERLSGMLKTHGEEVKVTTAYGRLPHAVGVMPADVAEEALEKTLEEGGHQEVRTNAGRAGNAGGTERHGRQDLRYLRHPEARPEALSEIGWALGKRRRASFSLRPPPGFVTILLRSTGRGWIRAIWLVSRTVEPA